MFAHRIQLPKVRLETEHLVIRLAYQHDAERLSDYYVKNREFLKPWEPERDGSYYYPSGWHLRLNMIIEQQALHHLYYFLLLDRNEEHVLGIANFSNIVRGHSYSCHLGYSISHESQGQGMMYEALQPAIRYMFRQQHIHRIMANYMPHNQRSGNLLARLGFEREGYAKNYLMINGEWQDHILTALINSGWLSPRKE